jgi:hypothetical protein
VPDFLLSLRRELGELRGILAVHEEPVPNAIAIPVFADDDPQVAHEYATELVAWLDERDSSDTLIIEIDQLCNRPAGLRAPWMRPRPFLDYRPSDEELSRLRPDPAGSSTPRVDWSPPQASQEPRSEFEERIERARVRWRVQQKRDGTGDVNADCHLPEVVPCHLPEQTAPNPLTPIGSPLSTKESDAPTLRIGGGSRRSPRFIDGSPAGPLGAPP